MVEKLEDNKVIVEVSDSLVYLLERAKEENRFCPSGIEYTVEYLPKITSFALVRISKQFQRF